MIRFITTKSILGFSWFTVHKPTEHKPAHTQENQCFTVKPDAVRQRWRERVREVTFWTTEMLILTCHFRCFVYDSIVQLWTAEVHFSSDIPQYGSRLFQSHSKFTKAGCFPPWKSHSLCYSTWSPLSILGIFFFFFSFCQPCKINSSL